MDPQLYAALGEIKGIVSGTKEMLREHIEQDARRFDTTFKRLDSIDADINQAKGAKNMVVWLAGGAGAVVSFAAWALSKILGS